jgi:hypothetical protein
MFNRIWKDQIQKPKSGATIWQPKEKMKPDKGRDCCQEAQNLWKIWYIRRYGVSVMPLSQRKDLNDLDAVKVYDEEHDKGYIEGMANYSCERFRSTMKGMVGTGWGRDVAKKILEEWDKCEGK